MTRLLPVIAAAALLVVSGGVAWGHAVLEATEPADGQAVDLSPDEVVLRFNEPVSFPAAAVRVFDSDGERVDLGDVGHGASSGELRVGVRPGLGEGTYVVTWRAVSADGHPVKGAFLFFVGSSGQVDESLVAQLFAADADRPYAVAATAVRGVMYAALLAGAGVIGFVLLVGGLARDELATLGRVARRSGAVSLVAVVAGVPLQAAQETGLGLAAFVRPLLLADTLSSAFGASSLLRLAGLVALVVTLPGRPRRAAWGAGIALGSLLLAGHSVTTGPRALVLASDAAHLAATALWFGGVVGLAAVMRRRRFGGDPVAAAQIVSRFSGIATAAVAVVVASGLAWAWAEVRALRALTSTAYGWALLAKIVLVGGVLLIGAYNNRRLVPAVAASADAIPMRVPAGGATDEPQPAGALRGPDGERAWTHLHRTVRFEAAGLALVALITAGLVYLQPAAEGAGITGVFSTYADLGDDYEVNLVVDPNRAGVNQIHLYLLDEAGRTADIAEQLRLHLRLPSRDIGPVVREPEVAGPGHWILTGPELSIAGRWEIQVAVRVSDFQQLETTIPVDVNP